MKKCIVLLTCFLLIATLCGNTYAREKRNPARRPYRPWSEGEFPEVVDPNFLGLKTSAAVDTYNIVRFDFEELEWQGWTQVDNTAQVGTFIHVDDFTGLGGGDFGRLYPLEGTKSMWCGVRPDPGDPYLCGWITPPGYGNDWKQTLVTDSLSFTGLLTFSYEGSFDSEEGYDQTFVEYDAGEGNWKEVTMYEGIVSGTFTHELFLSLPATKLRFRFESDKVYSDQDGVRDTDGAFIVDSLVIGDDTGIIDYENFEIASVGALAANGDGNGISWKADIGEGFGMYSGLATGLTQDHDPCGYNYGTQIVFFIGSDVPSTSYPGLFDTPFCTGPGGVEAPCQDEMVISPIVDLTKYSTNNNEIQDAEIPPGKLPDLGGLILRYTILPDFPLSNLVFSFWQVRDIYETGCPGQWDDDGYWYPSLGNDYTFIRIGLSGLIGENRMQVALGVADMCQYWYLMYGNCVNHTPAPWYDNVRIQRYDVSGPQWSYRDLDFLQDEFPTGGLTIEGWVRADAASDINSNTDPILRPGDSIVVTVTSRLGGGIKYTGDGWPMVYCHVRAKYIGCASSCPAHVHPKAAYLYGPTLAGTYGRYVSDDGAEWTKLQCAEARVGNWPGTPVPDVYMVDLNDSLFTRGYMIEYYFEAQDSNDAVSYLPNNAPTRAGRTLSGRGVPYQGVSYIFEITCLPLGCSDILYVDDFHGRGTFWGTVEQYFNPAFLAAISPAWPERYDVNNPSSLVGNGLSRSATSSILGCYYVAIVWDSGNLSNGTIGDGSPESDKTNDCQLLIDWMTLHPDSIAGAGLWVLGDEVAQDLAGLTSPQAQELLTTWCGVEPYPDINWDSYYALSGGFPGGVVTPVISGTPDGRLYHSGVPDQWYALGGCPIINQFDCLTAAPGATIAAVYPDFGPHTNIGAAIQNVKLNAYNAPIRTMWFGHSLMYMRDKTGGAPIIRNHIVHDVLSWIDGIPNLVITETDVPKAWNLEQNFPNPFNPQTTIRFDVKERGHVSLKIYNVAGQLVKTLVDEVKDASSYTIAWDGTNNNGSKVASGVYFYKMQSKEFSKTRKMVLLR